MTEETKKKETAKPEAKKETAPKKEAAKKETKKAVKKVFGEGVKAEGRNIRITYRKVGEVAKSIRGKKVSVALDELTFSKRRVAKDVKEVLKSAIANAEHNKGLDVDRLYVAEAFVGKSLTMKRFRPRAKGRGAKILKKFSNVTVIVKELKE